MSPISFVGALRRCSGTGRFVRQEFLPESLAGTRFYTPNEQNAQEAKIAERMRALWGDKYEK